MNKKERERMAAGVRRGVSRRYGFRQCSYFNYKVEGGFYFCLFFLSKHSHLSVKPMYADDLLWDILMGPDEDKGPLSLRGNGAFFLWGQELVPYDIAETGSEEELAETFERVFQDASENISRFLADHPNADLFIPDESKIGFDPDRLFYLMALIHNGREKEALAIIKEARRKKHRCSFVSIGRGDSYTLICQWCKRERSLWKRIVSAFRKRFGNLVKQA